MKEDGSRTETAGGQSQTVFVLFQFVPVAVLFLLSSCDLSSSFPLFTYSGPFIHREFLSSLWFSMCLPESVSASLQGLGLVIDQSLDGSYFLLCHDRH